MRTIKHYSLILIASLSICSASDKPNSTSIKDKTELKITLGANTSDNHKLEAKASIDDRTDLLDLNVNLGNGHTVKMSLHSGVYSLMTRNLHISNIKFSLPRGATISPDPNDVFSSKHSEATFTIRSREGKVGTPFTVKFYPDLMYTLIVIGDTEFTMRGNTMAKSKVMANYLAIIKKKNPQLRYNRHPAIPIDPELLMLVGDVSSDRNNNPSDFLNVFESCYKAGINCMNIYGNHDWDPIKWGNGSIGFTKTGEAHMNGSKNRILAAASKSGIELEFLGTPPGKFQSAMPYAFVYRGVRYYCGNSFWFMPYYKTQLQSGDLWATLSGPQFTHSDDIISSLQNMINNNKNQASIWMQHYPFANSDRWWGAYTGYGSKYNNTTIRKEKIQSLIQQTKNPSSFAGHLHYKMDTTYTNSSGSSFKEYVTPYWPSNNQGAGYFVLVSEKEGVLDVQYFSGKEMAK